MIWFIVGYFVLAIIANLSVSYIVIHKLSNKCGNNRELFHTLIDKYFRNSNNWLERNIPLPYIFDPIIKQVFFPFNIAAVIKCYREATSRLKQTCV